MSLAPPSSERRARGWAGPGRAEREVGRVVPGAISTSRERAAPPAPGRKGRASGRGSGFQVCLALDDLDRAALDAPEPGARAAEEDQGVFRHQQAGAIQELHLRRGLAAGAGAVAL